MNPFKQRGISLGLAMLLMACFVSCIRTAWADTKIPSFSAWDRYATSKELAEYNPSDRNLIRRQWFKKNIESLAEFQALSEQEQIAIFNLFLRRSIAIEEYAAAPSDLDAIEKAAEQGYSPAQCDLGIAYYQGRGAPKDYKKAVELWRKAAEQGYA